MPKPALWLPRPLTGGIEAGDPHGNSSGRTFVCVNELPIELQKVADGGRLQGAYVVKTSWSPASPVYSISRGFPIDRPDVVCRLLIKQTSDRIRDDNALVTCQFPAEIASEQVDDAD